MGPARSRYVEAAGESLGAVQGGLAGFSKDGPATLWELSEAFQAYPFGADLKTDLAEPLRARFAVANPAEACAPARERFIESLARQSDHFQAPGDPPAASRDVFHDVAVAPLVPDVEFFVNPNDYPATGAADPLPVFSFSKVPGTHGDILYPVWAFWHDDPWLGVIPIGAGTR